MLKSRLPEIAATLPGRVDAALKAGADLVAEDAIVRVHPHRLGGELEDAIHVDDRQREGIYVIAGDDTAFYGHLVEHGTSHSAPYPFLVPALEANQDRIEHLVRESLGHL